MKSITSLVEQVLKKHNSNLPRLKENLSTNLEFRLLFTIDLSKPFKESKKEFLRTYLNDLLTLSLGNVSEAAKKAQLHRRHLHRMINELDIKPDVHRRELLKPSQYMKENVYTILEETLNDFSHSLKIRTIYSNLDDISEIIAENISPISWDEAVELFEKEYLERALKQNNYDIAKTADAIDLSERTLYRKIGKLSIA